MTIHRRMPPSVLAVVVFASLAPSSFAATPWSWNGVWKGRLDNGSSISVTIVEDRIVAYAFREAPLKIDYSKVTPTMASFGDHDHYSVKLTKTGDASASARYHGRRGYAMATLTRR